MQGKGDDMSEHDFYLPGPENPMTSDPMHNFTRLVAKRIAEAFDDGFKAGAGAERSEAIRKSEAFDVIERERLTALAPSKYEPIPKWIVGSIFTHDSASGETLLSAFEEWQRRKGATP
jgi:hypothetical protein